MNKWVFSTDDVFLFFWFLGKQETFCFLILRQHAELSLFCYSDQKWS